jgi:hypothetical protein
MAARVAELKAANDDLRGEVARLQASHEHLERRLGEVGDRLTAALAERDRLAGDLAELRDQHETLAAEHATVTRQQDRERADAATPRIWTRWLRTSPDGGARIGPLVYTARVGAEMLLRVDHAQTLVEAGYVEPLTAKDSSWLDYWRLLHGGVSRPAGMAATAGWAADQQGRLAPVPPGWPEELSYARLHPEPVELPPGLEGRQVAATP